MKASAHYSLSVSACESKIVRLRLSDEAPIASASSTKDRRDNQFGNGFDGIMECRRREARTSSTRQSPQRRWMLMRLTSCARHWPACCGPSSSITTMSMSGSRSTAPIPSSRSVAVDAMTTGTTCTTRTSFRCLTGGNTPGMRGPGLSHPRAHNGGRGLRRTTARPNAARVVPSPSGQLPAYEWNFGDSQPPVHASSLTVFSRRSVAAATSSGSNAPPPAVA